MLDSFLVFVALLRAVAYSLIISQFLCQGVGPWFSAVFCDFPCGLFFWVGFGIKNMAQWFFARKGFWGW
jgi:hypothetical protein